MSPIPSPEPLRPAVSRLADAKVLQPHEWPGGIRLARLLTRATTGGDVLLGTCWLAPGERTTFDLTDPGDGPVAVQETYYLVSGRIRIRYDEQTVEAGAGDAVFFPAGWSYSVEAVGDEEAFVVYTVVPAAR